MQEELAQGIRAEACGVVGRVMPDESVRLEEIRDAGKGSGLDAVDEEGLEQEQRLERGVWCGIHAPVGESAAPLLGEEVDGRHDLWRAKRRQSQKGVMMDEERDEATMVWNGVVDKTYWLPLMRSGRNIDASNCAPSGIAGGYWIELFGMGAQLIDDD